MNEKILKYYNLIYKVMNDMHCDRDEEAQDEMFFEGLMGLYNGIKSYKTDGEASETTYYYVCIRNSITNRYKYNSTIRRNNMRDISLETLLYGNTTIKDILTSNINLDQELIKEEQLDAICKVLNKMKNVKFKYYFCDYYGIGTNQKTLGEIALKYGVSKHNVSSSLKQGIERFKKKVKKEYGNKKNN